MTDRFSSLWGSYVLQMNGSQIYFAGDTGYKEHFKALHKKHGAMQVSLLPIGAYEPRWFMQDYHMNPADAVMAASDLQSEFSIGIHFGTFKLTDEGMESPVVDLAKALSEAKENRPEFIAPKNGQVFTFTFKSQKL